MRLIYVAGRYTVDESGKKVGYSGVEDNIRLAEQLSLKLLRNGWAVMTPHKNTAHCELWEDLIDWNWEKWIELSYELLCRCDAIIMLKGWEISKGAQKEIAFAEAKGIKIYYETDGIPKPW